MCAKDAAPVQKANPKAKGSSFYKQVLFPLGNILQLLLIFLQCKVSEQVDGATLEFRPSTSNDWRRPSCDATDAAVKRTCSQQGFPGELQPHALLQSVVFPDAQRGSVPALKVLLRQDDATSPLRLIEDDIAKPPRFLPKSPQFEIGASSNQKSVEVGCHESVSAKHLPLKAHCAKECPFFAEFPDLHCHFQCVSAAECGSLDPNATIADREKLYCRRCAMAGCRSCFHDRHGDVDGCHVCDWGYRLVDGHCESSFQFVWHTIYAVIVAIAIFFLAWFVHLVGRPVVNQRGLQQGLSFRSRSKLHMLDRAVTGDASAAASNTASGTASGIANDATSGATLGTSRTFWPLSTNLLRVPVAGPGLALHFNFQVAVVVWASLLAAGWAVLAFRVDHELFELGLRESETPRQSCTIVAWGYEKQHSLMWVKVGFLIYAYFLSFFLALLHAWLQASRFAKMDNCQAMGMDSFAALCVGLLHRPGTDPVEARVSELIEAQTGQKVVGVSVCWDFEAKEHEVHDALNDEMVDPLWDVPFEATPMPGSTVVATVPLLFRKVDALMGFPEKCTEEVEWSPRGPAKRRHKLAHDVNGSEASLALLHSITNSSCAFAVFETEASRDAAVEKMDEHFIRRVEARFTGCGGSLTVAPGSTGDKAVCGRAGLYLSKAETNPDEVCWNHFTCRKRDKFFRLFLGIITILVALLVWASLFYLPYAYYISSFAYARGEEPGITSSLLFSMVVVAGNQIMYHVCSMVADNMSFLVDGHREAAYVVLYSFACFCNVILDLAITGYVSYKTMVGVGAKTYHGQLVADLDSFLEIFESYPMQKALGYQLFVYCWPSCFLIPFVIEPIGNIFLPFHISSFLLRTRADVQDGAAEKALAYFAPMDLARYADLLLNAMLAVLMLFFPGGYIMKTFGALVCSHVLIYLYDHYRVLRCVPSCDYSSSCVDHCVNYMIMVPCAALASCLAFKANCQAGWSCVGGSDLSLVCFAAAAGHVLMHWALLAALASISGPRQRSHKSYAEAAQATPCTWFSLNPVHCLRSRHVYEHNPSQHYFVRGKEHLMRKNKAIGAYFQDTQASEVEEFCVSSQGATASRSMHSMMSGIRSLSFHRVS